jgi:hypothetical protein
MVLAAVRLWSEMFTVFLITDGPEFALNRVKVVWYVHFVKASIYGLGFFVIGCFAYFIAGIDIMTYSYCEGYFLFWFVENLIQTCLYIVRISGLLRMFLSTHVKLPMKYHFKAINNAKRTVDDLSKL